MIELHEGNLLEADAEALVNTVNTVGVMGKGIALQFKRTFPDMFDAYAEACRQGAVELGHMHVYERQDLLNPRYIINFPTKGHWKGKSKLQDIQTGLRDLAQTIAELHISSIAVPPLGCGLGGLNWNQVRREVEQALADLKDVRVLLYQPRGAPAPSAMINRTKRPKMTATRANVLRIIADYFVLGYQLSLLELQKLLYFYQEAGEPLRLRFQKDRYGPYADNLRHVMNTFEGHFTMGYGDGQNSPDTQIDLVPGTMAEVNQFLADIKEESQESNTRAQRVLKLIEGFESPYGMELLASVHWVAKHEPDQSIHSADAAVESVHSWSERKRKMMRVSHIELAWDRLKEHQWIQ